MTPKPVSAYLVDIFSGKRPEIGRNLLIQGSRAQLCMTETAGAS
jgi:hypothetical protein